MREKAVKRKLNSESVWRTYRHTIDASKLLGIQKNESIEDYELTLCDGVLSISISTMEEVL